MSSPFRSPRLDAEIAAVQMSAASQIASHTEQFEKDRAKYEARLKDAFQANNALRTELAASNDELELWKSRALHTAEELAEQRRLTDEALAAQGDMVSGGKHRAVCTELDNATSELGRVKSELESLRGHLASKEQECSALAARLELVSGDKTGLLDRMAELEAQLKAAEATIEQNAQTHAAAMAQAETEHQATLTEAAAQLEAEKARSAGLDSDIATLNDKIQKLLEQMEKAAAVHANELATAHAREQQAYDNLEKAEHVCTEALAAHKEAQQRMEEMEQGTQMLYDDLEHALKSATELRSVPQDAEVEVECRYGAWVGLYRSIARTLRTKFPIARDLPSPTKHMLEGGASSVNMLAQSPTILR